MSFLYLPSTKAFLYLLLDRSFHLSDLLNVIFLKCLVLLTEIRVLIIIFKCLVCCTVQSYLITGQTRTCLQKDSKTEYSELLSEGTQTTEHYYLLLYDQHYTLMLQITALNMFVSQETGKKKKKTTNEKKVTSQKQTIRLPE